MQLRFIWEREVSKREEGDGAVGRRGRCSFLGEGERDGVGVFGVVEGGKGEMYGFVRVLVVVVVVGLWILGPAGRSQERSVFFSGDFFFAVLLIFSEDVGVGCVLEV